MATIAELNATVTDLQTTIDATQQKVADAVAAFEQQIADLQVIIADGGGATAEQLQTVVDNLTAAKADLESTPVA